MTMLDIGVGAGQTTPYFAQSVKEYIGIDYSSQMIQACRSYGNRLYYSVPLNRGSMASLRPSPTILKPNTTRIIAIPGARDNTGLVKRYL